MRSIRRTLKLTGLWKDGEFLKLWGGQAVSELGSRITRDGIPFAALLVLNATPTQMGFLAAAGSLPVLLGGLAAGVWVDRLRRRPVMIVSDLLRHRALSVPLAALAGSLSMPQLYLVIGISALGLVFDAAYIAYLPTLVSREHLLEGNSKLAVSESTAEILGPSLTGVLVQTITAPVAILLDALSYFVSVLSIALIRRPEPPPNRIHQASAWREAAAGVRTLVGLPVLRAFAGYGAVRWFFSGFLQTLYYLFAIRTLGIGTGVIGLLVGLGGVGSLLGALANRPLVQRWGLGRIILGGAFLRSALGFLLPASALVPGAGPLFLGLGQLFGDAAATVTEVNEITVRQSLTPDYLLGRVNSTMNLIAASFGPLGALAGGLLGERLGIPATLLVCAAGGLLAALWLFASPVRGIGSQAANREGSGA
jgi:predicted MFS family arabinose efflux permease